MEEYITQLKTIRDEAKAHLKGLRESYLKMEEVLANVPRGGPTQKRGRDWECEGRLWEGQPCKGCGNCDKKAAIIWNKRHGGDEKRHILCKSCKNGYNRHKKMKPK